MGSKIFMYMDWAVRTAQESYCKRMKVGCVITTPDLKDVLSYGYNGTIAGFPNECEHPDGRTNNNLVIHAEQNALDKLTASNKSAKDACVFITVAPCVSCAIRLINVGVSAVYYKEDYVNAEGEVVVEGLELLTVAGVEVVQITDMVEEGGLKGYWIQGFGEVKPGDAVTLEDWPSKLKGE